MNKKKKICKHNGGKGYWSNMKGAVCLKCGKEVKHQQLIKNKYENI